MRRNACEQAMGTHSFRHVTTEPELRRTIRSSRLPSSLLTSRTLILLASSPPRQKTFIY